MYNKLSLKDKAELFKLAIANGITDLNTIRDTYNKYAEGGTLDEKNTHKVGPTYDETSKRWINPYGKDITGQSFDGDYGVTTYYDTGAVEFVPFGKDPTYRYASNAPRKYIGGSTIEARQKYYDVDKEFTDNVKRMADKYGISANTLASRIAKEGPIDEAINNYNNTNGYLQRGKLLGPVWGLDDLGTMIHEGTVKVNPEMELFTDVEMENEKGRTTYSVASDNYLDGVEITAAALSYYKNEMKKRFPNSSNDRLEQLATAAFNMGISRAVELAKEGKIVNTYKPFINIKANGGPLLDNYNKYAGGGIIESNTEEALIDTAKGFIPIYGTYLDGVELYNNPSWENLGWFGISLLSEIPILKGLKGLKAASKLKKAGEALDAANNTYKRAMKQEARAHTQRLNRGVRSTRKDAVYDASKQVKRAKKEYNLLQSQVNNLVPDMYTPLYFTPNLLTEGIQHGLAPDNYNYYHRVE